MRTGSISNLFLRCQKHVLFKLTIAFIFLCCLDFIFGTIVRYFYFRQTSGPEFVTTYSMTKTNADVLIFGSSRANHHYHPEVFEQNLKMSCYNTGRDGLGIVYNYALLKAILGRYIPKIVILDLNSDEFHKSKGNYDKLSVLLPYYHSYPEIRKLVDLKSKFEKFKMLSHIYPYNSTLSYIILGNTKYNQKRRNEINGYVPLMTEWTGSLETVSNYDNYELDPDIILLYEAFIRDCCNAKIKTYIIHSPYYAKINYLDKSIEIGQKIAKKYNVPFYDFSNDTAFLNHPKLFSDLSHLNNEGAIKFSKIVLEDVIH